MRNAEQKQLCEVKKKEWYFACWNFLSSTRNARLDIAIAHDAANGNGWR